MVAAMTRVEFLPLDATTCKTWVDTTSQEIGQMLMRYHDLVSNFLRSPSFMGSTW